MPSDSRPASPGHRRGIGGASTFLGFRKYVMDTSPVRIYAMLNISLGRQFRQRAVPRPREPINAGRPSTSSTSTRTDPRDQGSHQRQPRRAGARLEVLKRARQAADDTGLPIMMHWTNERELLALLKRETSSRIPSTSRRRTSPISSAAARRQVLPQILELKDRGIWTESQAVNSHHSGTNSEKAFAQGWAPDVISTDMGAVTPQTPNGILPVDHDAVPAPRPDRRAGHRTRHADADQGLQVPGQGGHVGTRCDRRRHRHRSAAGELRADRPAEQQAHRHARSSCLSPRCMAVRSRRSIPSRARESPHAEACNACDAHGSCDRSANGRVRCALPSP